MSTTTAVLGLVKNADGDTARTALSTNLPANMDILESVLTGADVIKIPAAALVLDKATAALAANVTMTLADTYYTGPSVDLDAGVWLVMGGVAMYNGTAGAATMFINLWDGTTGISSAGASMLASTQLPFAVSGYVVLAELTTYKISAMSSTTGGIIASAVRDGISGPNASYIFAVRIG